MYESPSVMEMQEICRKEKDTLWDETRRLTNPQKVFVDLSEKLLATKEHLFIEMSKRKGGEE